MHKNTQLLLQSATTAPDSVGQPIEAWATYATVMGSVSTKAGSAYHAEDGEKNQTVAEVWIWMRAGWSVTIGWVMGGLTYEIAAPPINIKMQNRELLLKLRHVE